MSAAGTSTRFAYRAMSAGSGVTQGEIEARDIADARDRLRKQGLLALEVREGGAGRLSPARGRGGPATKDTRGVAKGKGKVAASGAGAHASRTAAGASGAGDAVKPVRSAAWARARAGAFGELALLLESGMALDAALETVTALPKREQDREALRSLAEAVREGRTLAEGLRSMPERFSPLQIAMTQVGEETGRLPLILRRLNEQEERAARLKQQVVSSLTYPLILIVVGALMMGAIVGLVVPRFTAMFEEIGVKLPLFSAIVIGISRGLASWSPLLGAMGLVAFIVLRSRWRNQAQRAAIERWILVRTPVGPLWWKHQAASFTGAMGMMLSGGAPMLRALDIARTTWSSVEMRNRLEAVIASMREGERLSEASRRTGLLPERSDKLVAVGEESGSLPAVFERMSQSMEQEVSNALKRALTLLEPLAILLIGLVVGAVVVAMLLAIFSINDMQTV